MGVFRLTEEMRQHGARPIWMGYIGADDVDATVAGIEAKGGKALMPAFDIPQGRIAMVADPQGNPFYVMKPIPPQGAEDKVSDVFSPTEEQRIGWNELTTADPVASRQFYGDLFGWTSDELCRWAIWASIASLPIKAEPSAPYAPCVEGGSQGWRYYIRVPSISKAVEAVKAGGGTISMGPHEVPGGDRIIIGNDPQGAEFALVGKS